MKILKSIVLAMVASICLLSFVADNDVAIQQKAKAENKNIVLYFSGSDWCSICHVFKKKVLSDAKVDSLISKHYVSYTADFPQRKKMADSIVAVNEKLAQKLNPDGVFPLFVIADANLNVKAKLSGNAKIEEVFATLQKHQIK